MPTVTDRLFIAIGVSQPKGGLEKLPGAISAARRMAAWAQNNDYKTLLFEDEVFAEITIEILRNGIASAIESITKYTELKRIIFFFAGHGAALGIGDQYWILSNWNQRSTEAIKVSALQRMLQYYGPRQVSIIGDACQEFSSKFIDLVGSPILDKPDEEQRHYELDQFYAVDVGKQAFMIKAEGEVGDFCLFTEVLLDALEGEDKESFETIGENWAVTSQSLARYLDHSVAREAGKYGVHMKPLPRPGFYTDRSYHIVGLARAGDVSPGYHGTNVGAPRGIDVGYSSSSGNDYYGYFSRGPSGRPRSVSKVNLIEREDGDSQDMLESLVVERLRGNKKREFVQDVGRIQESDDLEASCGICVSGTDVSAIALSRGSASRVSGEPNWFRVKLEHSENGPLAWSDCLITLADNRIASACVIDDFVVGMHIVDSESMSLFHRPSDAGEIDSSNVIEILASLHAGSMTQNEIIKSATMLRYQKHRIITLGCVVAQLYDAIRDVNSLFSMAAFYAMNNQPVPLDIILYGGGTITESDGQLFADIPAVDIRSPRNRAEQRSSFTYKSTPGFNAHPIAGRVPWMKQAWSAVATADCKKAVDWQRRALNTIEYLAPGLFTVARPEGREALYELANMSPDTTTGEDIVLLQH